MSEASPPKSQKLVTELKVSGHLMTLDRGLFCIFHRPGGAVAADASGLPGVRITLPPGAQDGQVAISAFRQDGWLSAQHDAALIRVLQGPADVLVTVYQSADGRGLAPNLQVLRLSEDTPQAAEPPPIAAAPVPAVAQDQAGKLEIAAHVQLVGDITAPAGAWMGEPGSGHWIEGFAITPKDGLAAEEIEYQAVLGKGWLSPWVEGAVFCGSRGMALPILGLRVRLRGDAAQRFRCIVMASFVDGARVGPVADGESCAAESLSPLEAFQIMLEPVIADTSESSGEPVALAQSGLTAPETLRLGRMKTTKPKKPPGKLAKTKRPPAAKGRTPHGRPARKPRG